MAKLLKGFSYLVQEAAEEVLLEGGGGDVLPDALQHAADNEDVVEHRQAHQEPAKEGFVCTFCIFPHVFPKQLKPAI